ncbi:VOC family protein [Oscillospiraceae bacterium CM]|nr:VOC family protein [Oscillospiraceae bacterium CM]
MNPFSHVDLRLDSFEKALPFYEALLPQLGFTRRFDSPLWRVFAADGELPQAAYIALTEDPSHKPNSNLIGFWAKSQDEVDRLAGIVDEAGGKIKEGPKLFPISPTYYAVFFEDPCGNAFEIVHRLN